MVAKWDFTALWRNKKTERDYDDDLILLALFALFVLDSRLVFSIPPKHYITQTQLQHARTHRYDDDRIPTLQRFGQPYTHLMNHADYECRSHHIHMYGIGLDGYDYLPLPYLIFLGMFLFLRGELRVLPLGKISPIVLSVCRRRAFMKPKTQKTVPLTIPLRIHVLQQKSLRNDRLYFYKFSPTSPLHFFSASLHHILVNDSILPLLVRETTFSKFGAGLK